MPTQIYNTASLTFEYGSQKGCVSSNVAVTTVQEALTILKSTLGDSYFQNSEITFITSINNNNNEEIKNIKVIDDLGTYSFNKSICESVFTPISYIGPAFLYLCGKYSANLEPKVLKNKLEFNILSIPPKSNALIIYKATVNQFAPLTSGSKIISTSKISSFNSINDSVKASCTLTVKDEADIRIIKNMNPNPVLAGEEITYNFLLYNYGNTPATNITLSDTFSPAPSNITVYLNSEELSASSFSYISNTLTLPSQDSDFSITIPAANFIQDNITGIISIEPGMINITAIGKI